MVCWAFVEPFADICQMECYSLLTHPEFTFSMISHQHLWCANIFTLPGNISMLRLSSSSQFIYHKPNLPQSQGAKFINLYLFILLHTDLGMRIGMHLLGDSYEIYRKAELYTVHEWWHYGSKRESNSRCVLYPTHKMWLKLMLRRVGYFEWYNISPGILAEILVKNVCSLRSAIFLIYSLNPLQS